MKIRCIKVPDFFLLEISVSLTGWIGDYFFRCFFKNVKSVARYYIITVNITAKRSPDLQAGSVFYRE